MKCSLDCLAAAAYSSLRMSVIKMCTREEDETEKKQRTEKDCTKLSREERDMQKARAKMQNEFGKQLNQEGASADQESQAKVKVQTSKEEGAWLLVIHQYAVSVEQVLSSLLNLMCLRMEDS